MRGLTVAVQIVLASATGIAVAYVVAGLVIDVRDEMREQARRARSRSRRNHPTNRFRVRGGGHA